jgi:hypothetical protein
MQRSACPWFRASCLPALVLVLALAPVLPAQAAGWVTVLKNSPAEDFNDADIEQFLQTAAKVLNAETPQGEVAWRNAESGAGGHFKEVGRSVDKAGHACRSLRLGVYAKQKAESFGTWMVCKADDGRWKVAHVLSSGESQESR